MFTAALPQSLYFMLPGVETLTLYKKLALATGTGGADAFAPPRGQPARRRPATHDDLINANLHAGQETIVFSFFNDGSDPDWVAPDEGDQIVDAAGVVKWRVKRVKITILETLYNCTCLKEWPGV